MQQTLPASTRPAPRAGFFGHLTRISNKLTQLGNNDTRIQKNLQVVSSLKLYLNLKNVSVSFLMQSVLLLSGE